MDDDHRAETEHAASSQPGVAPMPQSGAAERALAEAEQRRLTAKRNQEVRPREVNGRQGPEPVRYGDWENKGIAYDF